MWAWTQKCLMKYLQMEFSNAFKNNNQLGSIPGMQSWFNGIKPITEGMNQWKKHMIISISTEKIFDKIQHPYIVIKKNLKNIKRGGNLFNLIKGSYERPPGNTKLHGKTLTLYPSERNKSRLALSSLLFRVYWRT